METYSVRVAGDSLIFSAAHFITFGDGTCEPLHGHNYCVAAEVEGPLNASQYVVDFCLLNTLLTDVLAELDHHTLLPADDGEITVVSNSDSVEVRFADRCWQFPKSDCVLLPVANTTSEAIAYYIAQALRKRLDVSLPTENMPRSIKIEIRESPGHTASCRVDY